MIDQIIEKESTNKALIQLGHSMIIICFSTRVLKGCYDERRYKNVEKLKEIEEFLGNKGNLDED